ncbi:MAG: hypothetical protein ABFC78_02895 [Methanoregula sp.]|jgi:hypothetical protein
MANENEIKATNEVLIECRKCGKENCKRPCALAAGILAKYNLEYKG